MHKQFTKHITFIFLLALSINLAWSAGNKKKGSTKSSSHIQNELESKAEHKYIKGMGFFLQQDFNSALKEFKDALALTPENAAINYKLAETYYLLNFPVKAIGFANEAIKYDEKNKYYHILLANMYMDGHNYENAAITYEKMLSLNIDGEEYYYDVAEIYQQLGINELKKKIVFNDTKEKGVKRKIKTIENKAISYLSKSLQAYNKLESHYGIKPEIISEQEKINLLLGRNEDAFSAGKKLVDSKPTNIKYKLSLAELYYKHDSPERAISYLKEVIKSHEEEPQPYLVIYTYLSSIGKKDEANDKLADAFESKKMPVDSKVKFITSLIKLPGKEQLALTLANKTVENHPDLAQTHSVKGDVLYLQGRIKDARASYLKALEIEKEKQLIWEQVILLDSKTREYDLLIEDCNKALDIYPNNSIFWFYHGLGSLLKKDFNTSIQSFNSGLSFAEDNPNLKNQFLANLGDAYNELGNYTKSDSAYNTVLENDPKNTRVLNNYSYYLSLRKERLDEAEAMIETAVRINPTDPTYLDTYGWVLYQIEKYEKAKKQFEKALLKSNDATIIDHYGDVLFQLGETEEALTQWKRAKEKGLESDLIDKKIAEGKIAK